MEVKQKIITFARKFVSMKKIFILFIGLMLCVSGLYAQLAIFVGDAEITNTTVSLPAGVDNEFYYKVKNTGSQTIENIKSYLRLGDEMTTPVLGEHCTFQICTNGNCGMNNASPKFTLAAGEEMEVHLTIKSLSATEFFVTTYPNGENPVANFNLSFVTTGISNSLATSFNVYPSPADNSFTIENNFGKNAYVEIYNALGQMVKRVSAENANSVLVNCSTWKNGYYVCRSVKDGKVEKAIKVVVVH